jgi:hypothetical protein
MEKWMVVEDKGMEQGDRGVRDAHTVMIHDDTNHAPAAALLPLQQGGFSYHVVDRHRSSPALSRRLRGAASLACAGLLVAVSVNIGYGGSGWTRRVALESVSPAPEKVMVSVPEGVAAGQLFDFDVPGRGEFSAVVPANKSPGKKLELEVNGLGAPILSEAQRPLEEAQKANVRRLVGLEDQYDLYKAVVPESALTDHRFTVDVPGHGEVLLNVPAGKRSGDEIRFSLPPPAVRLRRDHHPVMARVMAVELAPSRQQAPVTAPAKAAAAPASEETKPEKVSVQVPAGAVAGEVLVVKGSAGNEFEVTVPTGAKPGSSFLAILPSEPVVARNAAAMRISAAGRTMSLAAAPARTAALAGTDLADAVTSAVTDAVQDAVTEAATQAAQEEAAAPAPAPAPAPAEAPLEQAAPAPVPAAPAPDAPAPDAEAAPPATEASSPAVEAAPVAAAAAPQPQAPAAAAAPAPAPAASPAVEVVAPKKESEVKSGLGHRDSADAFANQEPIEAQAVPEEYEGEAILAPEASTNRYTVTVYEPLAKAGRRNRGVASTWDPYNEVQQSRRFLPVFCGALLAP